MFRVETSSMDVFGVAIGEVPEHDFDSWCDPAIDEAALERRPIVWVRE
jgi:hypothetical protein